eukprot:TRINITY_DN24829_c1_g1_i1.p1 TRINITY_DN24829_c1_g1~~TRINITY_DN24829_c1_g1_i1.p1  ORF type:complete len:257 (+),score=31.57 TRINITY_DN24829_c1_g1_i1:178-948(+)
MEDNQVVVRRRLACSFGGWKLPKSCNVVWWSVLRDIPDAIIWTLVKLVSVFRSIDAVFDILDVNKNGSLNRSEFLGAVQYVLELPLRRLWADRETSQPTERERRKKGNDDDTFTVTEDFKQQCEDSFTATFRWLDSSNDGKISSVEFVPLKAIWLEMQMSIAEFRTLLVASFGSLEDAWRFAEKRHLEKVVVDIRSKRDHETLQFSMSRHHVCELAERVCFSGPAQQIFVLLVNPATGTVGRENFLDLSRVSKPSA